MKALSVQMVWIIDMIKLLTTTALLGGIGYFLDVPVRRSIAAKRARHYADSKGLPLLNVGAGTDGTALFGTTLYGDVNVDLYGSKDVPHGTPGTVTYADAQDLGDFKDGQFGAVLATHLIEHLDNPDAALSEFRRVTGNDPDALFIVTPSWWSIVTWMHPAHLWYATDGAGGTKGGRLVRLRKELNPIAGQLTSLRGI